LKPNTSTSPRLWDRAKCCSDKIMTVRARETPCVCSTLFAIIKYHDNVLNWLPLIRDSASSTQWWHGKVCQATSHWYYVGIYGPSQHLNPASLEIYAPVSVLARIRHPRPYRSGIAHRSNGCTRKCTSNDFLDSNVCRCEQYYGTSVMQWAMREDEPVWGYKSKITTSLPVAPGTEYLTKSQLTLREENKLITSKGQWHMSLQHIREYYVPISA